MKGLVKKIFLPVGAGAGAFVLAIASAASYLLGWLRDAIFVRTFGVTAATDSYFKAFLLPDTLLTICITGALLGLVIPLYVQARQISEEEGQKAFGTFFFVLNSVYFLATVLCFVFLEPLLTLLFPDTLLEQQSVLVVMSRILLLSNSLFAFSNFLGHFLLAQKRFLAYSLAPLLYNVGIIAGILLLHETFGIYAAAYGALLGAFLHFLFRLCDFLLSPERFSFSIDIKNPFFRQLLHGMWPKVVALLSIQIGFYWFARLGDGILGAGNYSAFQYARNLQSFAVSLFGISLATAVFPFLSEYVAEKKLHHFMFRFEKTLRQILFLAIPSAVGMVLLAPEIVRFVYGTQDGNILTIAVLVPLALAIPFESTQHLLVRSFHVLNNTILPMLSSLLFLTLLIGGSAFLVLNMHWGVAAFGVAYVVSFVAQISFLFFLLPRMSVAFPWRDFLKPFGKVVLLSSGMALVVLMIMNLIPPEEFIWRFLLPIASGGVFYLGGALLWKCPEMSELPLKKWLGVRRRTSLEE